MNYIDVRTLEALNAPEYPQYHFERNGETIPFDGTLYMLPTDEVTLFYEAPYYISNVIENSWSSTSLANDGQSVVITTENSSIGEKTLSMRIRMRGGGYYKSGLFTIDIRQELPETEY